MARKNPDSSTVLTLVFGLAAAGLAAYAWQKKTQIHDMQAMAQTLDHQNDTFVRKLLNLGADPRMVQTAQDAAKQAYPIDDALAKKLFAA